MIKPKKKQKKKKTSNEITKAKIVLSELNTLLQT